MFTLISTQVYLSEICDVLAIAMAELPNLLSPPEVAEALLMVMGLEPKESLVRDVSRTLSASVQTN